MAREAADIAAEQKAMKKKLKRERQKQRKNAEGFIDLTVEEEPEPEEPEPEPLAEPDPEAAGASTRNPPVACDFLVFSLTGWLAVAAARAARYERAERTVRENGSSNLAFSRTLSVCLLCCSSLISARLVVSRGVHGDLRRTRAPIAQAARDGAVVRGAGAQLGRAHRWH